MNAVEKGNGVADSGGKGLLLVNQKTNYVKREKCKHFGWLGHFSKEVTNFPFWYILSVSLPVYHFISNQNGDDGDSIWFLQNSF